MDLVSFIPGVGPTASFSPGATTPPPFNVAHTGLTDGTGPTNASNNMAEIYNRLLLQIQATIVASGLTPDPNNWTQLPEAIVAFINTALNAYSGTVVTQPQFDRDTSIATTEFVQRALGNYRGIAAIATSQTITASDAGRVFYVTSAGVTITLNPAGLIPGAAYTFITSAADPSTLTLSTGQFRPQGIWGSGSSVTLKARSQYTFVWDGNNMQSVNAGGANDQTYYNLADVGYIKLESGFMIQWGYDVVPIGETTRTISFGVSFPNTCKSVSLTGRNDGTTITNNNIPQLVSTTASSFVYINQGIAEPTTPIQPNQGVHWIAIGH